MTSLQKLSQNPGHRIYVMTVHDKTNPQSSRSSSAGSMASSISSSSYRRFRGGHSRKNPASTAEPPKQLNPRVRIVGMIKVGVKHLFLSVGPWLKRMQMQMQMQ